jgi:hypothetical protein
MNAEKPKNLLIFLVKDVFIRVFRVNPRPKLETVR